VIDPITELVTKMTRRGRPPIHRKAMTAAQRQARRREKLKKLAKIAHPPKKKMGEPSRPPVGYGRVKHEMMAQGHQFEAARREFGFEEGLFLDGALVDGGKGGGGRPDMAQAGGPEGAKAQEARRPASTAASAKAA
jgi:hypothetical protein